MKTTHLLKLAYPSLLLGLATACGPSKPAEAPKQLPPINAKKQSADDDVPPAKRVETAIKLIQAKSYSEAKKLLERAVADDSTNSKAYFYLGLAEDLLGEKDLASTNYGKALELDPKLTEAAENLSGLLLEREDYERAAMVADVGLKSDPKSLTLLTNLPVAQKGMGKLDEAVKSFEALFKVKDDDERLRFQYAEALTLLDQKDKALGEWGKLLNSKDADILAAMSKPLAKLDAYDKCVGALDKAIDIRKEPEFFVRRGLCRQKVVPANVKAEFADYEGAIALKADYTPAHYYLGMAHFKNKDLDQAKSELEKVVASGDEKFLERAKKTLEVIAATPASKKGAKKK
ncbi:MAG: tetratricopeptide repeat protein [Polyangiaceae bacterium]|nr:tetratricopeptide repeat protein [Polyangiaceae bacterium]